MLLCKFLSEPRIACAVFETRCIIYEGRANLSRIISIDEVSSLQLKSFAIINLHGVFTKKSSIIYFICLALME